MKNLHKFLRQKSTQEFSKWAIVDNGTLVLTSPHTVIEIPNTELPNGAVLGADTLKAAFTKHAFITETGILLKGVMYPYDGVYKPDSRLYTIKIKTPNGEYSEQFEYPDYKKVRANPYNTGVAVIGMDAKRLGLLADCLGTVAFKFSFGISPRCAVELTDITEKGKWKVTFATYML